MSPLDPLAKRKRECPVCASEQKDLLFQQRFAMVSDASIMNGYDVVVCTRCGCAFADNIPQQPEFDTYYREMSKYAYQHRGGKESEEDLARFREISTVIRRFAPSEDIRILEVGCATGRLLSLLKDSGLHDVVGLDPSPACAQAAQELYEIPVLTSALSDLPPSVGPFDFLILVGVLEHFRDLAAALTQVRSLLSDKGRTYVEVPDALEFARWLDAPFQQFSIEHINFFSMTTLTNLMQVHGFRMVYCKPEVRPHTRNSTMPVISGVYEKHHVGGAPPERDVETEAKLREYLYRSQRLDDHIRATIDKVVESHEPTLVWGVGTHTQRLFATSRLSEANIQAFVDSNPAYHGKWLRGVPIIAPAILRQRSEPILISSCVFQAEIAEQIRRQLNCSNQIILLYPEQ